jgi:DNA-binding NarL/FixJ family response regulator
MRTTEGRHGALHGVAHDAGSGGIRVVPYGVEGQYLPKRPRVLLAEDHPGVAKSVCRLLALDCEVVGTIADGGAVVGAAQRLEPDVIVVDLNLPHVHGLEACRQIKHVKPAAIVIVFSTMTDPDLQQRSFESGASAFVCKGSGDLLSTIKRLCDDRVDAGNSAHSSGHRSSGSGD